MDVVTVCILQKGKQSMVYNQFTTKVSAPISGHFCALVLYLHRASEFI